MARTRMDRRTLLRGAGIALGLPVLEAMTNDCGLIFSRAAWAAPPTRLITYSWANGVNPPTWFPTKVGRDFDFPSTLMPLQRVKDDITIVSGFQNSLARAPGAYGSGPHGRALPSVFSGMISGPGGAKGPSIDAVASQMLGGKDDRYPVISLAASTSRGSLHFETLTYLAAERALAPERSAVRAFSFLTGAGGPMPSSAPGDVARIIERQKSVLDYVGADIARLQAELGQVDRSRLEQHLTAVRGLEGRLGKFQASCNNVGTAPKDGQSGTMANHNLMFDIMTMALSCGVTRFGSFGLNGAAQGVADWSGFHPASHAGSQQWLNLITLAMEAVANAVAKLKQAGLLDSTVLIAGSELGNGQIHRSDNIPWVVATHIGGARGGEHIKVPPQEHTGFLAAMLKLVGANVPKFGADGAGPTSLPGLVT